jgi:hypothetical protein
MRKTACEIEKSVAYDSQFVYFQVLMTHCVEHQSARSRDWKRGMPMRLG